MLLLLCGPKAIAKIGGCISEVARKVILQNIKPNPTLNKKTSFFPKVLIFFSQTVGLYGDLFSKSGFELQT